MCRGSPTFFFVCGGLRRTRGLVIRHVISNKHRSVAASLSCVVSGAIVMTVYEL